jgi:hypothetical protein
VRESGPSSILPCNKKRLPCILDRITVHCGGTIIVQISRHKIEKCSIRKLMFRKTEMLEKNEIRWNGWKGKADGRRKWEKRKKAVPDSLDKKGGRRFHLSSIFYIINGYIFLRLFCITNPAQERRLYGCKCKRRRKQSGVKQSRKKWTEEKR